MKLAVDVIVYRQDGKILFIERKNEPFKGMLALPGGFVEDNERIYDAGVREVFEETGIKLEDMRPVKVADIVDRDPRERVVSCCYYAEVPKGTEPRAGDDAAAAKFFAYDEVPPQLAFDHFDMIGLAMGQELGAEMPELAPLLNEIGAQLFDR